jgi:S-adenosylmethionine-dependent methyltransferase
LSEFATGEDVWRARLGTLRQVVRQELVSRQLAEHVPDWPRRRVLDIGCGQGTQLIRLARQGHELTGLDGSEVLLAELERSLETEPAPVRERVRIVRGEALEAPSLLGGQHYDVVLCHGVLMYFADPMPLLAVISRLTAAGGLVSLLVRNGDALAMRPGLRGEWKAASEAFEGMSYRNRIGVQARADRRAELIGRLRAQQLTVRRWYGVRVLTDVAADEAALPEPAELGQLLDCEERAGRTDPYRAVAPLLHLVAQRTLADRAVSLVQRN